MAKGDKYIVMLRGIENPVIVEAEKAGRKLELDDTKEQGIQWLLIHEKTWTDKLIKTTRFSATDVVAMIADIKDADV